MGSETAGGFSPCQNTSEAGGWKRSRHDKARAEGHTLAVLTRRSRVNTVVDVHEQRPNTPCTRTEGLAVPGECRSRPALGAERPSSLRAALGAERPSSLRSGRKRSARQLLKSLAARSRLSKFEVYGLPVLGRMGCQRKGSQLGFFNVCILQITCRCIGTLRMRRRPLRGHRRSEGEPLRCCGAAGPGALPGERAQSSPVHTRFVDHPGLMSKFRSFSAQTRDSDVK